MPTQNTRQQDFFLLAKDRYKYRQEELPMSVVGLSKPRREVHEIDPAARVDERVEAARKICNHHNGCVDITLRDTAWCLLADFVTKRVILTNPEKLASFMHQLGPHAPFKILNRYSDQPGGYYAGLISALIDEIAIMQVFKDGELLISFPVPEVDPMVEALFYNE